MKSRPDRAMATARRRVSITRMAARPSPNGRVVMVGSAKRRRVERRRGLHVAHSRGPEHLAWYAGITVMALFEIVEWPVAIVIAVGHEIAHRPPTSDERFMPIGRHMPAG